MADAVACHHLRWSFLSMRRRAASLPARRARKEAPMSKLVQSGGLLPAAESAVVLLTRCSRSGPLTATALSSPVSASASGGSRARPSSAGGADDELDAEALGRGSSSFLSCLAARASSSSPRRGPGKSAVGSALAGRLPGRGCLPARGALARMGAVAHLQSPTR